MTELPREDAAMPYDPEGEEAGDREVHRVKARHEMRLLALDGVEGVGIGRDEIGDDAIVVYLSDASAAAQLPDQLDGVPVILEITGPIDALPK